MASIIAGSRITMTPARVAWHNMVIHPLYGALWALGARGLADRVHEWDIGLERDRWADDTTTRSRATGIRRGDARNGLAEIPKVKIIFTCTACAARTYVNVPWGDHHCLPSGWLSRDVVASHNVARRTDHIFACSPACCDTLDERYPPALKPKWFRSS